MTRMTRMTHTIEPYKKNWIASIILLAVILTLALMNLAQTVYGSTIFVIATVTWFIYMVYNTHDDMVHMLR